MLTKRSTVLCGQVDKAKQIRVSGGDETSTRSSSDCLVDRFLEVLRHHQLLVGKRHRKVSGKSLLLKKLLIILSGVHPQEHQQHRNRLRHIRIIQSLVLGSIEAIIHTLSHKLVAKWIVRHLLLCDFRYEI